MKTIPRSTFKKQPSERAGFTLTELLVVIAIIGLLALMILPALARTGSNSQAAQCMNNLKQLTAAWKMYADDNQDNLVSSLDAGAGYYNGRPAWMTGTLTTGSGSWNINIDIVKSPLWNYCGKQVSLFKCPADQSTVIIAGVVRPRVRSISMNQVFDFGQWLTAANWRTYAKMSEIIKPNHTFVLIDENTTFINDGGFATQCDGSQGVAGTPAFIDLPSNLHNFAAGISFADGHTEMHRWLGDTIKRQSGFTVGSSSRNLADFNWLAENTTVKK